MDIKILKSSILSNTIPKFLVFFIEEPALYRQYIRSISDTIHRDYVIYYTVKEALYDIETNITDDHIYVVFDDLKVSQDEVDRIVRYGKNVVVCYNMRRDSVPKGVTSSLAKYKDNFVDFKKVDKDSLLAYATKLCKTNKCSIEQSTLIHLIECCDNDLGILLSELNKIFTLEQSNSTLLTKYMIDEGFIDYREVSVGRFVSAVIRRDNEALSILNRINEQPVQVLNSVYYVALEKLKETRAVDYSTLMRLCFNIQKGILDGTLDARYALRYLLLRWLK